MKWSQCLQFVRRNAVQVGPFGGHQARGAISALWLGTLFWFADSTLGMFLVSHRIEYVEVQDDRHG